MKKKFKGKSLHTVKNSGFSEGGANRSSGLLKAYNPLKSSALADIDSNLEILRGRSSDLSINTPIGSAAIGTSTQYTIGTGLRCYPRVKAEMLGMSAEEADAWNKHVAREFDLWASSKLADIRERNNFYDLQEILYRSYLADGDSFAFIRSGYSPEMPYTLRIQALEGNRINNPYCGSPVGAYGVEVPAPDGINRIVNGIELGSDGEAVAYWVSSRVPNDMTTVNGMLTWTRIKVKGELLGLPNALHICHDERPEQYRGVPYLAPVIESMKQISRYSTAELTSAIMKTFFTLFLTQQNSSASIDQILQSTYSDEDIDRNTPCCDPSDFAVGHGTINALPMGVDVKSIDSSKQSSFDSFTSGIIKQIAAAIGQPYEVLMKCFSSSYSASRAALLQAWDQYKLRREWFARDFCQPVYEMWLMEAVATGRVEAPLFWNDPAMRYAYFSAEWYGPAMSILDPVKETNASLMKIANGLSTYEKEAAQYGGDFKENIEQLARERRLMADLGIIPDNKYSTDMGGEKENEQKVLENQEQRG